MGGIKEVDKWGEYVQKAELKEGHTLKIGKYYKLYGIDKKMKLGNM